MPSRPWLKFYPADWQADQALRSVGLEARGLWLECMCIMHRAEPYGHLVVNGRPVTDTQLAVLAGTQPDRVPALMAELATAGVFSRNRAGVVYSRRMTRDEKQSKDGATGKITGKRVPGSRRHQAVEKALGNISTFKVVGKVADLPPSSQMPDTRYQSREKEPPRSPPKGDWVEIEFEEFWRLYPRREDRGHALRAYRAARKKVEAAEIVAGVRRYAASRAGQDAKFTALPGTWLNGERWADEMVPMRSNGGVIPMHPGAGG